MVGYASSLSRLRPIALLLGCTGLLAEGCARPPSDIDPVQSPTYQETEREREREMKEASREFSDQVLKAGLVFEDEALRIYLQELLDRLLIAEGLEAGEVGVAVLESTALNAHVRADGVIYLNLGVISQIENEAQIVFLIGHELAHYLGRHALKREIFESRAATITLWRRAALGVALLPLGQTVLATADIEREGRTRVLAPLRSGYSQSLETESDDYGFMALVRGGYDPTQSARFLQLMLNDHELERQEISSAKGDEEDDPYFFASHPDLLARLGHFRKIDEERRFACKQAPLEHRDACVGTDALLGETEYRVHVERAVLETARLDRKRGRRRRAIATIERMLVFHPESVDGWTMLGEIRGGWGPRVDGLAEAIEAIERAIEIDPTAPRAHRELGFLAERAGRFGDARLAFARYLSLDPEAKDRAVIEYRLERHRGASGTAEGTP